MYSGQTASSSSAKTAEIRSGRSRNETISRFIGPGARPGLHLHDRRRDAEPFLERAVEIGEVVEADREGDVADLAAAGRLVKQEAAGQKQPLLDDEGRAGRACSRKHAP